MINDIEESRFIKITKYIDEFGLEFSNIITNGVAYALVGIFYGNDGTLFNLIGYKKLAGIILIIGVIVNIFFFFKQKKKSKTMSVLKKQNNIQAINIQSLENQIQEIHRNYSEIFNEHLAALFFKLKLSDKERISMYKFESEKFYIIGRYSSNPSLKKIHRNFYPAEQGLISKAWTEGEYFRVTGVPEYGTKTRTKIQLYTFFNNISKIDKSVFENLTMKSKSFYLKAFMDSKGIKRTSLIVVESENSKAFLKEDIDKIVNEEESKLTSFVEKIDWNFPSIDNAQNSGF